MSDWKNRTQAQRDRYNASRKTRKDADKRAHPEKYKRNAAVDRAKARAKDPDYYTRAWLRTEYGITLEEYERMRLSQGGLCAICRRAEDRIEPRTGAIKRLGVDHDHASGRVRELLCYRCNLALGMVRDDVLVARAIVAYLEKHK